MANVLPVFREYGRLERLREARGLSGEELERWMQLKRLLARHLNPRTNEELVDKQASLRVPSQLQVAFDSDGKLRECLVTNISRDGVFVATESLLPIGTPLKLRIQIDEAGLVHELMGEVASVNAGRDMKSEDHGMGIRFCSLSEEQLKVVEQLYGRAMDDAIKSVS